jgi:hypothetical protein
MFLNDINARIGELDAELEGLAALTDPTDDDVARTEQILAERDELRQKGVAAAERTQRIAEAHARAKAEGRTVSGAAPFQIMQKVDPYAADTRMMSTGEVRDAARAILDRPEARHLAADQKEKADGLIQKLDGRLAKYTIATSQPAYRSAVASTCCRTRSGWPFRWSTTSPALRWHSPTPTAATPSRRSSTPR